jgi:quercetin dioxygenase-like cupin family protein
MKHIATKIILFISIVASANSFGQDLKGEKPDTPPLLIFPIGEKINNANFTGTVYLKILTEADSLNPTAVGSVTFEPTARTNWHLHPGGQILLVIDGVGFYQEKGQPKRILRKGDVVKCPPNVPHWHGASDDSRFIQVAVTNNAKGSTVWLEPVSDLEYNK